AVELAEIGVEIFGLHAEIGPERIFKAGARGTAQTRGARRVARVRFGLEAGNGETAGEITQQVVPAGIANAAAQSAEPVRLGRAGHAAAAVGVALHIRPVDVAFGAPDPHAGLKVIAEREAGE